MKKYITVLLITISINLSVQASVHTPVLGKIENVLYGFEYNNETDTQRLDRIENTIYGKTNTGDVTQRMKKLKIDISADLIGQEITPKEDTLAEDNYYEDIPVADANIEYPAVDELELQVFNKKSAKKDIKERLSDLETKTFGKQYSQEDLATRLDRLKAELKPSTFMNNNIAQSSNEFYDDDVIPLDKEYHLDRYDSPYEFDYDEYNQSKNNNFFNFKKVNLSSVENKIFKHSYQNESTEKRLARVESTMFGTEFSTDDEQTRLNRISSAMKAQKSSMKYDSNKLQRNMATAMQIGTILLMVLACIL